MTKLIIDERDLRCTILQGMRELLRTGDLDHRIEEVIQQVIACGDPIRFVRAHIECTRMPGGTGPCACLDGCGSCDSCGEWLGDDEQK